MDIVVTTVVSIFFDLILCVVLRADHKKEPPKEEPVISCQENENKATSECKEEFDGQTF